VALYLAREPSLSVYLSTEPLLASCYATVYHNDQKIGDRLQVDKGIVGDTTTDEEASVVSLS
jgi:hypothetical protein